MRTIISKAAALVVVFLLINVSVSGEELKDPLVPVPVPPPSQTLEAAPTADLQFQEVVLVEGATKDQLYSAGLAWFGRNFGSGKEVLQVQDREAGTLIGRALFQYKPVVFVGSDGIRGVVRYLVTIEVKDGRYRYTIGSFIHDGNPANPGGQFSFGILTNDLKCPTKVYGPTPSGREETWSDLKMMAKSETEKLLKTLKSDLAAAIKSKENW